MIEYRTYRFETCRTRQATVAERYSCRIRAVNGWPIPRPTEDPPARLLYPLPTGIPGDHSRRLRPWSRKTSTGWSLVLKHIEVAVDHLSFRRVPSGITSHRLSSTPRLSTCGRPPVFRRAPVSPHRLHVPRPPSLILRFPWSQVQPRRCLSPEDGRYHTRSVARIAPVVSVEPTHLLSIAAALVSMLFQKKGEEPANKQVHHHRPSGLPSRGFRRGSAVPDPVAPTHDALRDPFEGFLTAKNRPGFAAPTTSRCFARRSSYKVCGRQWSGPDSVAPPLARSAPNRYNPRVWDPKAIPNSLPNASPQACAAPQTRPYRRGEILMLACGGGADVV